MVGPAHSSFISSLSPHYGVPLPNHASKTTPRTSFNTTYREIFIVSLPQYSGRQLKFAPTQSPADIAVLQNTAFCINFDTTSLRNAKYNSSLNSKCHTLLADSHYYSSLSNCDSLTLFDCTCVLSNNEPTASPLFTFSIVKNSITASSGFIIPHPITLSIGIYFSLLLSNYFPLSHFILRLSLIICLPDCNRCLEECYRFHRPRRECSGRNSRYQKRRKIGRYQSPPQPTKPIN